MVTDADWANTCKRKIKALWLISKAQKPKGLSKMSFTEKPFEDFRRKNTKYTSSLDQTTPWNTRPLNATIENEPCN